MDTKNAIDDDKKPYTSQHLYALYSLYTNALKQEDFSAWLSHKNPEHTPYAAFYENILDEFENTKKSIIILIITTYCCYLNKRC